MPALTCIHFEMFFFLMKVNFETSHQLLQLLCNIAMFGQNADLFPLMYICSWRILLDLFFYEVLLDVLTVKDSYCTVAHFQDTVLSHCKTSGSGLHTWF